MIGSYPIKNIRVICHSQATFEVYGNNVLAQFCGEIGHDDFWATSIIDIGQLFKPVVTPYWPAFLVKFAMDILGDFLINIWAAY